MSHTPINLPGFKIPLYNFEFVPGDIEELVAWCDREATFYEGIIEGSSRTKSDGALEQISTKSNQIIGLRSLSQRLKTAVETDNHPEAVALAEGIARVFDSTFVEASLPPSNSYAGLRLAKELAHDQSIGLPALYAMSRPFINQGNNQFSYWYPEMWRGFGVGAVLSMASPDGVKRDSFAEALRNLLNNSQADIGRSRSRVAATLRDVQKSFNEFKQKQILYEGQNQKSLDDSGIQLQSLIGDARKEIDEFKRFVKAEIALKAPVSYWEEKATGHKRLSERSGIAVVVVMIALSLWAYIGADAIKVMVGTSKDLNYSGIVIIGAMVTMALWLLRLIVRIFLSQQHLETDANERVAMVKTYIALQEAGLAPKDADLTPILVALFRPTSDGIIKDEAMPPVFAEFLTRNRS